MSAKSLINTVLKATWHTATDIDNLSEGIGIGVNFIAEKTILSDRAIQFAKNRFKKVDWVEDGKPIQSMMNAIDNPLGVKMKGGTQLALAGAGIAVGAGLGTTDLKQYASMGYISGEQQANMIGEQTPMSAENAQRAVDNGNIMSRSASGDLVFALHGLR